MMTAFDCVRVNCNQEPRWLLRSCRDAGDWLDEPGFPFFATEAECEMQRQRLDLEENGAP